MDLLSPLVSILTTLAVAAGVLAPASHRTPEPPPDSVFYVSEGRATAESNLAEVVFVRTGVDARAEAVTYVRCKLWVNNPHWSSTGRTVLFKTGVTCVGNLATILVEVRTYLARRKKDGSFYLVAAGLETRRNKVNVAKPPPYYCPLQGRGIHVKAGGWFRGAARLSIIEPGGVKTPAVSKQSSVVPVS